MDGICTLGNDRVCDQVIALLNSIDAITHGEMPVCIYPYDENMAKLEVAIADRDNVQIYRDRESMNKWDDFARQAWDTHPTAHQDWQNVGSSGYHRFGTHRRYCAFDGPFDRFLYMDADTLLLRSPEFIFAQLEQHDCIVYDFQRKDLSHVYAVNSPKLKQVFPSQRLETEIFCSGFYASKKDLFDAEKRDWIVTQLRQGEGEILYPMAPDQTLLNYMMMRSHQAIYNFALELPPEQRTGCCVTSPHFVEKEARLYDNNNRLTYLHYIGISSQYFTRVCAGENINFPYRDLFLHYRYKHEPEQKPQFRGKATAYNAPPNLAAKVMKKLGLAR
jgi:hypothetical protein